MSIAPLQKKGGYSKILLKGLSPMYLLFDLDGTLTEPEEGITNSIKYALRKFGIEEKDRQKLRLCIGPPLIDSFREFWGFDQKKAELAVVYYREYFAEKGIFENKVYEGIESMLQALHRAGHTIILATSKPEEYATRILEHFDLLPYFTAVVGNTLKEERPKKQDVLFYIREMFGDIVDKGALMIGDRKYDVEGAAALGIDCAAVLYGHGSREELTAAGAKYLFATPRELTEFLLRME